MPATVSLPSATDALLQRGELARSANNAHPSQTDLRSTGGDGRLYSFAVN
jgi:hypothetical protein